MARGLKTNGIDELAKLRKRVTRQHNFGRISRPDRDYLIDLLDKVEARIVKMEEKGDDTWD